MTEPAERTSFDPDLEVLGRHHASFVLDYLQEAEHEDSDRASFLGRVRFRLSKRSDLSDTAREEVFDRAGALSERLAVRLVPAAAVDEAGRLCLQIARELEQEAHASVLQSIEQSWPSIIAHEVWRLLGDLAGDAGHDARRAVSPEAVLFQLQDVVQTLIKFPALVMIRALIENGTDDDRRFAHAECYGRLWGGEWLGLARKAATRVSTVAALKPLHALAGLFATTSPIIARSMVFCSFATMRSVTARIGPIQRKLLQIRLQ